MANTIQEKIQLAGKLGYFPKQWVKFLNIPVRIHSHYQQSEYIFT